jgi:hypothetical protein
VKDAVGARLWVLTGVSVAGIIKVTVGEAYVGVGGMLAAQAFKRNIMSVRQRTAQGSLFVFIISTNK